MKPRLELRRLTMADLDAFHEIWGDSAVIFWGAAKDREATRVPNFLTGGESSHTVYVGSNQVAKASRHTAFETDQWPYIGYRHNGDVTS